jgi:hypothetical protein
VADYRLLNVMGQDFSFRHYVQTGSKPQSSSFITDKEIFSGDEVAEA